MAVLAARTSFTYVFRARSRRDPPFKDLLIGAEKVNRKKRNGAKEIGGN
jgi:hypothetical protein